MLRTRLFTGVALIFVPGFVAMILLAVFPEMPLPVVGLFIVLGVTQCYGWYLVLRALGGVIWKALEGK